MTNFTYIFFTFTTEADENVFNKNFLTNYEYRPENRQSNFVSLIPENIQKKINIENEKKRVMFTDQSKLGINYICNIKIYRI